MEINVIVADGDVTSAWHINPTEALDGSLTIKPADSAWVQVIRGLEEVDVDTSQQIDPTREPWPKILQLISERETAANEARRIAAEKSKTRHQS